MPKHRYKPEPRQLDRFAPSDPVDEPVVEPKAEEQPDARAPVSDTDDLTDPQLLTRLVQSSVADVGLLGDAIVDRRPKGWQAAALALWDRFLGFGVDQAMPEQIVVLRLAELIGDRGLIMDIVAREQLLPGVEPPLLTAAASAGVAMPTEIVMRGLSHQRSDVRRAAVQLAMVSYADPKDLHPCLTDPVRDVRREAAIALCEAGDRTGRDVLISELRILPSQRLIEALSFVANEDVVIKLGQFARDEPKWCEVVLSVLETIDHPKARKVAAGLMA